MPVAQSVNVAKWHCVLALALVSGMTRAQESPDPVAAAVDVVEIEVPVQVLRDGQPVRGLSRDDFTLVAGGRKQEILGFVEVDLEAHEAGASAGQLPTLAARRHFLLLFDLSFSGPDKVIRARDAAFDIVRQQLAPSDLISVATFSLARGVQVQVGFTPDHEQAELAILGLGMLQLAEGAQDPLGLVFRGPEAGADFSGQLAAGRARELAASGLESEQIAARLLAEEALAAQGQAQATLDEALTELAETLRPVPGQKHVIYLSEGSSSSLLLGIGRGATSHERRQIEATNEAAISGEVWNVNSNLRFGSTHHLVRFESMLKEFVRAGAAIQAIDVGGLRAGADTQAHGEETLFMMADKTGGELIRNYNDLGRALDNVLRRTAVSYVLTFAAPTTMRGGRYERIKVRLADKAKGVRLHHRPGYFTPVPYAERSASERRVEAARSLLASRERRELDLEVEVQIEPGADTSRRNVVVDLSVATASLPQTTGAGYPSLEIYGYAIAAEGRIVAHFDGAVPFGSTSGDRVPYRAVLSLAPGTYELRLLARETSRGATATRVQRLEVSAQR